MNFSWKDVFNIAKKFLDINQAKIAEYLKVAPSTISKLKDGTHAQPSVTNKDIYKNLFAPDNPNIYERLGSKDTKVLLMELKDIIKEIGLDEMTQDVKSDTYKEFVMELLALARNNSSSSKKNDAPKESSSDTLSVPDYADNISHPVGAQLHISHKYKNCLFCMNWKGNANFASESFSDVFGRCIVFDNEKLSTNNIPCEFFRPNHSRITSYELRRKSG